MGRRDDRVRRMLNLRLEPEDEYLHPLEAATNFNESMYFNFVDQYAGVGGFFRLGNRANEGYAEMTTCLYLPGGRAAFMYDRPKIDNNDAFDAGGMRFEVIEPFEELRVTYDARVVLLDDPRELEDPKQAFTSNPWTECRADLTYRAVSPPIGGERRNADGSPIDGDGDGFAKAHYEQHVSANGTIEVGDMSLEVKGYGLRDHSWGPRFWQAPWWYRWLTANFGADFGFQTTIIASADGTRRTGGMVLHDGAYHLVRDVSIDTDWSAEGNYQQTIRIVATTDDDEYHIEGRVGTVVPLRNRRVDEAGNRLVTRISEGLTEWRCNGRIGYGIAEYLDQIIDGTPVGLAG